MKRVSSYIDFEQITGKAMSISIISYSLHDTVVEQFNFNPERGRLIIIIWEKIVDSTTIIWRQLTISGVRNIEEIEQYQKRVDAVLEKTKREALGYRIDRFNYCNKPRSETRNFHLLLDIDHLGILTVNCAKFTIQVIDSKAVEFKT